jgi:hypothetical protein
MAWAIEQQIVQEPTARHVLLCLANYANEKGAAAFPSVSTMSQQTGLSERTVRYKLAALEQDGVIRLGNQAIAAAYIDRHDRRPTVYNLAIERGAADAPREENGVQMALDGVQMKTARGAPAAPNPSFTRKASEEQELVQPPAARSRFADFWLTYPNKKGRKDAAKAWHKRNLDSRFDELVAHVRLMVATDSDWARGYAPMGSTYINQDRWEDVPKKPPEAGPRAPYESKTLTGLKSLQGMKSHGLVHERDHRRTYQADVLELGSDACLRLGADHGGHMD